MPIELDVSSSKVGDTGLRCRFLDHGLGFVLRVGLVAAARAKDAAQTNDDECDAEDVIDFDVDFIFVLLLLVVVWFSPPALVSEVDLLFLRDIDCWVVVGVYGKPTIFLLVCQVDLSRKFP